MSKVKLSIVVPCYNEEEVLIETHSQLNRVLLNLIENNEISELSYILYVDDGSKDNTWSIINDLNQKSIYCKGLKLSRNVGHQKALFSGLLCAVENNDIIISIDADLQDDIHIIPEMIARYNSGFDIIYGVRKERKTDSFFKKYSALFFYKLMNSMGVESVYNHADYRLMSKRALKGLIQFKEKNLFIRGLVPLVGYKSSVVYYDRKIRFAGESKYPLVKMLNFAIDGITSFSVKPLRMIFFLGVITFLISFFVFLYIIYSIIIGKTILGWSSLIVSIWILGSLSMISIGILGEYIGKIYTEVKNRPQYIIEKKLD